MKKWFRLVRFSHTLFALPFALIGLTLGFLEVGAFSWRVLLLVLGCMVAARSAAMAYNRIIDRKIDALNPRTQQREIPHGTIGVNQAGIFVALCSALFILCCYFLNRLVFFLSPVALFVILSYSHSKRFTWLCHLWLGLGLGLTPIGGYMAVTGQFSLATVLIGIAVALWTAGFDIIYALQDEAFDRQHSLNSIPATVGRKKAIRIARITHLSAVLLLAFGTGLLHINGVLPPIAMGCFAGTLVYQHTLFTAKDISRVDGAFMLTNGVNSLLYATLVIVGLLL